MSDRPLPPRSHPDGAYHVSCWTEDADCRYAASPEDATFIEITWVPSGTMRLRFEWPAQRVQADTTCFLLNAAFQRGDCFARHQIRRCLEGRVQ